MAKTDEQLYNKYGLDSYEICFIISNVKGVAAILFMNKDSYFYFVCNSLWSSSSFISGFGSIILALVSWRYGAELKVSLFAFVIVIITVLFLLQVFIRISLNLYVVRNKKCTVLTIRESYGIFKSCDTVIALTTYVDYLTENGIVSIFYLENGFERQIAVGQIINIQEDKKVQILMFDIDREFSCEKLLRNESDLLEKLYIKPIIKLNLLEAFYNGK